MLHGLLASAVCISIQASVICQGTMQHQQNIPFSCRPLHLLLPLALTPLLSWWHAACLSVCPSRHHCYQVCVLPVSRSQAKGSPSTAPTRIPVPPGTVIKRKRGGTLIADLTHPGHLPVYAAATALAHHRQSACLCCMLVRTCNRLCLKHYRYFQGLQYVSNCRYRRMYAVNHRSSSAATPSC